MTITSQVVSSPPSIGTERARHDAIRRVLELDSAGNALDTVALLLNDTVLMGTPLERLSLLIAQKDWAEADAWLTEPEEHRFTDDELLVMGLLRQLSETPEEAVELVADADADLKQIAIDVRSGGHGMARILLERYAGDTLQEPVILPGEERSMQQVASRRSVDQMVLELRPDPASTMLSVVIRGEIPESGSPLVLIDGKGQGLSRRPLKPDQFIVDLSVGALPGGLYRVVLVDRSGLRGGASLSVVR